MKYIAPALLVALALTGAARADAGKSCTCQNLESLQQETENAAYEAQFFKDMAAKLKAIEDKQDDLNKNHPSDRDAGRSVMVLSGQAREEIMKTFSPPHPQVKGYTGPQAVTMKFGTCENVQAELDGVRNGSPCKEIGDIVLNHEAEHRAICAKMGADTYWARWPSYLAAEEADRYAAQAKAMREALKHVLDLSTVEIDTLGKPTVQGHGVKFVYKYVLARTKVSGKSSPGSDTWDLKGDGIQKGTIESVSLPGASCTSSGALQDAVSLTLTMDGFKMGLAVSTKAMKGDVKLKCSVPGAGSGWGQSMRPMGDGGSGTAFTDKPVQLDTVSSTDYADSAAGQVMAGSGMTMSGQLVTTVTISCPAQ